MGPDLQTEEQRPPLGRRAKHTVNEEKEKQERKRKTKKKKRDRKHESLVAQFSHHIRVSVTHLEETEQEKKKLFGLGDMNGNFRAISAVFCQAKTTKNAFPHWEKYIQSIVCRLEAM